MQITRNASSFRLRRDYTFDFWRNLQIVFFHDTSQPFNWVSDGLVSGSKAVEL